MIYINSFEQICGNQIFVKIHQKMKHPRRSIAVNDFIYSFYSVDVVFNEMQQRL